MKLRIPVFLAVFLVALAAGVQHGQPTSGWLRETSVAKAMGSSVLRIALQDRIPRAGTRYLNLHGRSSDKTTHDEKRHRKTLVSQAIVADFSLPRLPFRYCSRNYSLFLPGGCTQYTLHDSPRRGPPFHC